MLHQLKQWWDRRRITKNVVATINNHQGFSGRSWDIAATMPSDARQLLADEVVTWFRAELPHTATPYGLGRYQIHLGYAHMAGTHRTFLGHHDFPAFNRLESPTILDQLYTHLMTHDWTLMPTLTTLEVYLLSYGDLFKPMIDADANRR